MIMRMESRSQLGWLRGAAPARGAWASGPPPQPRDLSCPPLERGEGTGRFRRELGSGARAASRHQHHPTDHPTPSWWLSLAPFVPQDLGVSLLLLQVRQEELGARGAHRCSARVAGAPWGRSHLQSPPGLPASTSASPRTVRSRDTGHARHDLRRGRSTLSSLDSPTAPTLTICVVPAPPPSSRAPAPFLCDPVTPPGCQPLPPRRQSWAEGGGQWGGGGGAREGEEPRKGPGGGERLEHSECVPVSRWCQILGPRHFPRFMFLGFFPSFSLFD